jgi:hypothetical protein
MAADQAEGQILALRMPLFGRLFIGSNFVLNLQWSYGDSNADLMHAMNHSALADQAISPLSTSGVSMVQKPR